MLIKTARFNQLRNDHDSLQKDYAHLEKQAHEKDMQAASLGSLATEVSALYGLTASKLAAPMGHVAGQDCAAGRVHGGGRAAAGHLLRTSPMPATTSRSTPSTACATRRSAARRPRAIDGVAGLGTLSATGGIDLPIDAPNLWPVIGPITSSFGQREDPVTGNGEGEFHTGIDISAPMGTPIRATADGTVKSAEMESGYGREVIIDHGHGMETCYAHMSGFAVMAGQTVVRGQVIGYVGISGRTTGAHLHYEVRIRNTPVNPHKYLHATLASLSTEKAGL